MQFCKKRKEPPFYSGLANMIETFTKVLILVQLSETAIVKIIAIYIYVLRYLFKNQWNEKPSWATLNLSKTHLLNLKFLIVGELRPYSGFIYSGFKSVFAHFNISQNQLPKRVIVEFSKRKDANRIRKVKKNLKGMDVSSIGIRSPVYINDSLCKYYKMLWQNVKNSV